MPRENKVFEVHMRREAVDDLDEIRRFIQNDSFARARSFLSALKGKIFGLKRFPHRGSRARLLGLNVKDPEIRFLEYTDQSSVWTTLSTGQHNRTAGKGLSACRPNSGPVSKGYLTFYVIEENVVTVLHVTGPGQDWMRLFL